MDNKDQVEYTGNGTAGREADVRPTGFFFQMPKQEPVAWFMEGTYENGTPSFVQVNGETDPEFYVPLYAAPPQREWQRLTDEDINDHWINAMWNTEGTRLPIPEFARAIEAKLKEKNK